jgi:hypothetical protein
MSARTCAPQQGNSHTSRKSSLAIHLISYLSQLYTIFFSEYIGVIHRFIKKGESHGMD